MPFTPQNLDHSQWSNNSRRRGKTQNYYKKIINMMCVCMLVNITTQHAQQIQLGPKVTHAMQLCVPRATEKGIGVIASYDHKDAHGHCKVIRG